MYHRLNHLRDLRKYVNLLNEPFVRVGLTDIDNQCRINLSGCIRHDRRRRPTEYKLCRGIISSVRIRGSLGVNRPRYNTRFLRQCLIWPFRLRGHRNQLPAHHQ